MASPPFFCRHGPGNSKNGYICATKSLRMLLRRLCSLSFSLLAVCEAAAQLSVDGYYPYAEPEERRPMLLTDSSLFYRAVRSAPDLYGETADFDLPQVAVRRRGAGWDAECAVLDGIELPYRYFTALRLLGAEQSKQPGTASIPGTVGREDGLRAFRFSGEMPLQPYYASVRFSGRSHLIGARVSATGELGRGWYGSVAADARTGRDLWVQGVFTHALTVGFRLARRFGEGHEVALLLVVPPSMQGTRLSSTEEAFALTGDPLYNPAWGFQNGKVRNSRVRRETVPLGMVVYRGELSPATSLRAALAVEAGVRSYSALGWYDARTPMPDNYRYLPSHTGDRETERAWRAGDERYTQIDWDALIARNRMAGGAAVYALEDRAGRTCDLRGSLLFTTRLAEGLALHYGVAGDRRAARYFKRMRDLLGAEYVVDIDQYLVDDDTYGNRLQNDLRHPDRTIRTGDRFGYDYELHRREVRLFVQAAYRSDRIEAGVAAEFGAATLFRRGRYEKELFPGAGSFGASRRMKFAPYTLKASFGRSFSPRSYLGISAMAAGAAPDAAELFFQPQYNNRTIDDPCAERRYAVEALFRRTGERLEWQATLFASASFDGVRTLRYYDDPAGRFCDLCVSGIARQALGAEVAARITLSPRWRVSLAASAGSYRHIRDPRVVVLSDADNTAVESGATSRMGDCRTGGAPGLAGCAGAGYYGPKGWGFRLSAGYAGARYVEASPLRRTERIVRLAGTTPESFAALTEQERLADAFTLDAALFRRIALGRSSLTATLMLRNLTGGTPRYDGYESLRIRMLHPGDATEYEPHATRYTSAYPRTFSLSLSWRF